MIEYLNTGDLREFYINSIPEEIKTPPTLVQSVNGRSRKKTSIKSQGKHTAIFAIEHRIVGVFVLRTRTKIEVRRVLEVIQERDHLRNWRSTRVLHIFNTRRDKNSINPTKKNN